MWRCQTMACPAGTPQRRGDAANTDLWISPHWPVHSQRPPAARINCAAREPNTASGFTDSPRKKPERSLAPWRRDGSCHRKACVRG